MKEIASEELQFAADTKVIVFTEIQIVKNIEVKIEDEFGFAAGVGELAIGERAGDREQMIGDTLHGGDDDGDAGFLNSGANEACGVEHAVGAEKRAAAELERDYVAGLLDDPAGRMHSIVERGGAAFV
jgi:hypothetical protein